MPIKVFYFLNVKNNQTICYGLSTLDLDQQFNQRPENQIIKLSDIRLYDFEAAHMIHDEFNYNAKEKNFTFKNHTLYEVSHLRWIVIEGNKEKVLFKSRGYIWRSVYPEKYLEDYSIKGNLK